MSESGQCWVDAVGSGVHFSLDDWIADALRSSGQNSFDDRCVHIGVWGLGIYILHLLVVIPDFKALKLRKTFHWFVLFSLQAASSHTHL